MTDHFEEELGARVHRAQEVLTLAVVPSVDTIFAMAEDVVKLARTVSELRDANCRLCDKIDEAQAARDELQVECDRLRAELARRKPAPAEVQ